ncbi:MAG: methyl-accepting chemotaxis protein [Bacillota bacterium]
MTDQGSWQDGRGFGIVAGEIRKMAASSAESIKEVVRIINMIKTDSEQAYDEAIKIESAIGQVAEAVAYIAESIEEFSGIAQRLNDLAEKLDAKS